jgi:predicted alpha/beta-fold hydrolase
MQITDQFTYTPPLLLQNGLVMTVYTALIGKQNWQTQVPLPDPPYQPQIFLGAAGVPIYGIVAIPERAKATLIGTYGITGTLENQWFLQILGRKAFAQGYAIAFFDWRAHGKTAELSPALTSDGLYEGEDFVQIAAQAKAMGCPPLFWFTGFSLGGQLALWAVKAAQTLALWGADLDLQASEIGGAAVICPSLDSSRSLRYLTRDRWGRYLEQSIVRQLKRHAWQLYAHHPQTIDPEAIARVDSIWAFDHELVIGRLGFSSVEDYYAASSPLHQLPHLQKPTLILYAADDPMFDPTIIPDLQAACAQNPAIDLVLTQHGGHVGYLSSRACQQQLGDRDPWWAWNRILDWLSTVSIAPTS